MKVEVFTVRSVAISIAAGVLAAAAFGLLGVTPGLAVLTGLPVGALVLAVSIGARDGRFDTLGAKSIRRWRGVWVLAWIVLSVPAFMVGSFLDVDLNPDNGLALSALLLATGLATYSLGGIVATLNHLDGEDEPDPRLHRVTPGPDAQRHV